MENKSKLAIRDLTNDDLPKLTRLQEVKMSPDVSEVGRAWIADKACTFVGALLDGEIVAVANLRAKSAELAWLEGIRFVKERYTVPRPGGADVVVTDMYPFDTEFISANNRALWPIRIAKKSASRVVLGDFASCKGMSAYLCGPPAMIEASGKALKRRRMAPRLIFREEFTPAVPAPSNP